MCNKNKSKTRRLSGFFYVFLVILFAVSFLTVLNIDTNQLAYFDDLLTESLHTGLVGSPGAKLALNYENRSGNQLASSPKDAEVQDNGSGENEGIAATNIPKVIFDVSVNPVFEKNNKIVIFFILVFVAVVCFIFLYFLFRVRRKRLIKKIQKINYQK